MNKVMLIGNVGREPEMSYTPTGSAVTKFTLAVNRRWNDRQSGEKKEETTWFNIVAWDKLAETCSQYVHKGSKLFVEGRFATRTYTDKDNIERRVFEVIMTNMELLDSRAASAARGGEAAGPSEEVEEGEFPF
jgi:single-strand DNA-binding protein